MKPQIRKEPKGVVLIITPFYFPVHLTITHVVSSEVSYSILLELTVAIVIRHSCG